MPIFLAQMNHQSINQFCGKFILKKGNFLKKFRIEIGETIESDKLVLENGLTC